MTETKELTLADANAGDRPWEFPVKRERLTAGGIEHDRFAIIRQNVWDPALKETRDIVIGDVGENYDVVTFQQMMLPVFAHLEEDNDPEQVRIKYTEVNHGERGHFRVTFGDDIDFGPIIKAGQLAGSHEAPSDRNGVDTEWLRRALDFSTAYKSGYGLKGQGLFEQLRCINGLIIPEAAYSFNMRHVGWDNVTYSAKVDQLMDSVLAHHSDALTKLQSWKSVSLDARNVAAIFNQMKAGKFPTGFINDAAGTMIQALATNDLSAWLLYSELTNSENVALLEQVFHQQKWNGRTFELIDIATQEAA